MTDVRCRFYGGSLDGRAEVRACAPRFVASAHVDGRPVIETYERDRTKYVWDSRRVPVEIAYKLSRTEDDMSQSSIRGADDVDD